MTKAAELAKMGEVLTNSQIGGRRNIVINGAMQVAQRSTSVTGIGAEATYFTVDRLGVAINGTTAGRVTMSQASDGPSGFANSMKYDVTTADTSIASSESFGCIYRIEGQDVQQFKKGTSDAEKGVLSFYVKGTAKTFVVEIRDDNSRQQSHTFSVTSDWSRVVIPITADTTGAIDDDNTTGLTLVWWLHAGTDFTSGTISNDWVSSVNANRMVGCESIFSSTDNEFFITGIQLEVGEQATPFEHRSFGEELRLCQRYYEVISRIYPHVYYPNVTIANVHFTEKRATPSFTADTNGFGGTLGVSSTNSGYLYRAGQHTATVDGARFDAEL